MKDGSFVTMLFVGAIIIMLLLFFNRTIQENDRMRELIVDQQQVIETQNEAIKQMRLLTIMQSMQTDNKMSPIH
tara:strand:+ start:431 stop:652 length:222 start_codon:yes stop_codon:yes gene_type:complete